MQGNTTVCFRIDLELRRLLDGGNLVSPMLRSGRPISTPTLPTMLQSHRVATVAHGFRSSFRDWAAEETDHDPDPD